MEINFATDHAMFEVCQELTVGSSEVVVPLAAEEPRLAEEPETNVVVAPTDSTHKPARLSLQEQSIIKIYYRL